MEYNERVGELQSLQTKFLGEINAAGFDHFGLHIFNPWSSEECPEVTLTSLPPSEQFHHDALVSHFLKRDRFEKLCASGEFWLLAQRRRRFFMLPYDGAYKGQALLSLRPRKGELPSTQGLRATGVDFIVEAVEVLRQRESAQSLAKLTEMEKLCLTLFAEGVTADWELRWHGLSEDEFDFLLHGITHKMGVRNISEAVALAQHHNIIACAEDSNVISLAQYTDCNPL